MTPADIDLADLASRFDIPGKARLVSGPGGLPCVEIQTPAATATACLHGGHLTHYQPAGHKPVLFMSDKSWFEPGKPIRGGVPVCFPWFGSGPDNDRQPGHGFARIMMWMPESIREIQDDAIELVMLLRDDEHTRAQWPAGFELRLRITVGSTLTMSLELRNTGQEAFTCEQALHTYFIVGDVRQATVHGLEDASWLDKAPGAPSLHAPATGKPIAFTGETDRVYISDAAAVIEDPSMKRRIRIDKNRSANTVVWNPWVDKSAAMPDFGDEEWPGMVCVETANVRGRAWTLAPGESRAMSATIAVQKH